MRPPSTSTSSNCPATSPPAGSIAASRCSAGSTTRSAGRGHGPAHDFDVYRAKAVRLLGSEAVRRAFRLDGEDPRLRDRYGRTKHGQSVLLARRLVEAGVRFVTVYDHQDQRPARQLGRPPGRLPPPQGRPAPAGRSGLRRLDRRPDRPRPARVDAGDRAGRVRPHPEDQRQGGPRPLAVIATARCSPAAGSAAAVLPTSTI